MNAIEARNKSIAISKKKEVEAEIKRIDRSKKLKETKLRKHKEFYLKLKKELTDRIGWAVKNGDRSTEYQLGSFYKPYECYADYFMEHFEFIKELKKVIKELKKDHFKVIVEGRTTTHDSSSDYMNSGGECGSMTPSYTYDTFIEIFW